MNEIITADSLIERGCVLEFPNKLRKNCDCGNIVSSYSAFGRHYYNIYRVCDKCLLPSDTILASEQEYLKLYRYSGLKNLKETMHNLLNAKMPEDDIIDFVTKTCNEFAIKEIIE
jgi:hypothetical protein